MRWHGGMKMLLMYQCSPCLLRGYQGNWLFQHRIGGEEGDGRGTSGNGQFPSGGLKNTKQLGCGFHKGRQCGSRVAASRFGLEERWDLFLPGIKGRGRKSEYRVCWRISWAGDQPISCRVRASLYGVAFPNCKSRRA